MKLHRDGLVGLCLTAPLALSMGCYAGTDVGVDDDQPAAESDGAGGETDGGTGDDDEPGEPSDPEVECLQTTDFFREEVWSSFMSTQCLACHNPAGEARHSDLVLQPNDVPGYMEANLTTLRDVARLEIDGTSLLLLKPSGAVEHGGAQQFAVDDERYAALQELVAQLEHPVHCADDADYEAYFQGVDLLDFEATLRRATFTLASRHPTEDELAIVRDEGEAGLDEVLTGIMDEPGFSVRITEMYNDRLLTDAYLPGTLALDLLDSNDYPQARWFSSMPAGAAKNQARNRSNDALAREPLQLIAYIIEQGLPFTDIVSADYTVANPYLARVYGLDLSIFDDPEDPDEWRQVQLESIPHAGVLTTPAFVNRYPTTDTNRNRGRALVTLQYFLATDVMRLAARPIDGAEIADHNPTMYDPACTSCHEIIDPVAGAFANWDEMGRYRPRTWYQDMRPAGLGDALLPTEQKDQSLVWLGSMMADDPRFARAVVETMYSGLTGQQVLTEPTDAAAADYAARIRAFQVQDYVFKNIAEHFIASDFDVRKVIVELVKTPYFRAVNVEPVDEARAMELADVGAARLVTPEQLDRRIQAATGYAWADENGRLLPLGRPYHLMYGGIDSETVTERLDEISGVMVNIADRMAHEVACLTTATDFTKPPTQRMLFPHVEIGDLPSSAEAEVRDNLVFLHERLLGEVLTPDDPEVDRTLALFQDVLLDGQSGIAAGDYPQTLIGPCRGVNDPQTGEPLPIEVVDDPQYTVRAWMAVVAAMLADQKFLFE